MRIRCKACKTLAVSKVHWYNEEIGLYEVRVTCPKCNHDQLIALNIGPKKRLKFLLETTHATKCKPYRASARVADDDEIECESYILEEEEEFKQLAVPDIRLSDKDAARRTEALSRRKRD